jgi:hypothetical protein
MAVINCWKSEYGAGRMLFAYAEGGADAVGSRLRSRISVISWSWRARNWEPVVTNELLLNYSYRL